MMGSTIPLASISSSCSFTNACLTGDIRYGFCLIGTGWLVYIRCFNTSDQVEKYMLECSFPTVAVVDIYHQKVCGHYSQYFQSKLLSLWGHEVTGSWPEAEVAHSVRTNYIYIYTLNCRHKRHSLCDTIQIC